MKKEPEFCKFIRAATPERLLEVQGHLKIVIARLTDEMGHSGPVVDRLREVAERFPAEPAVLLNINSLFRDVILDAVQNGIPA